MGVQSSVLGLRILSMFLALGEQGQVLLQGVQRRFLALGVRSRVPGLRQPRVRSWC